MVDVPPFPTCQNVISTLPSHLLLHSHNLIYIYEVDPQRPTLQPSQSKCIQSTLIANTLQFRQHLGDKNRSAKGTQLVKQHQ